MENGNKMEWEHFCRLGEMIGDGLHHEEPWILKEYKILEKILLPETKEEKEYKRKVRKIRNDKLNEQVLERLKTDRCSKCGGKLKQTRSGSRTVVCDDCKSRYKYRTKK